jgi:outer membrane protein assembly factor BamB
MLALVGAYWALYSAAGMFGASGPGPFFLKLGALAVLLLIFLGWWLFNRRLSLGNRLAVLGVAVAAGVGTISLCDKSLRGALVMGPLMYSVQTMLTAWVIWLFAMRGAAASTCRNGMIVIAVLAWVWALGIRADGLAGDGSPQLYPRWTASGEEQFLAAQSNAKQQPAADAAASTAPLKAAKTDWPAFRGADRDGAVHGVEIRTDVSETPPKEVWKIRVGPGWSSIAIVGDSLFTQEQNGEDEEVVCYDANTGKSRWTHKDRARFTEAVAGAGPRATPTFDNGKIYALGASGILNCLDAAKGEVKWSKDVKADGQEKTPYWGFSSSPLIVDGEVIVFAGGGGSFGGEDNRKASDASKGDAKASAEGKSDAPPDPNADRDALLAYNAESGELMWRSPAGHHSYSSAQLAEFDGTRQVLFLSDNAVVSVDPATGKQLWQFPANAKDGAPNIQPHVLGDSALTAAFSGQSGMVRGNVVKKDGKWAVDAGWANTDTKPFFSDFVQVGDNLYGFDGSAFCCVDVNTGKRQWKQGRSGKYGSGQVLLVADQPVLVVITEAGEVVLVAPNPEKLEELGRFKAIEGKTWNHPTIVGNRLYVRNAEEMACYEF